METMINDHHDEDWGDVGDNDHHDHDEDCGNVVVSMICVCTKNIWQR